MGRDPGLMMVGMWKGIFPMLSLFIGLSCCLSSSVVQSVAAASEWPMGLSEEYTMALINVTYRARNGSMLSERTPQIRNKNSGRFAKGGKISDVRGVVVHVKSIDINRNDTLSHYGCGPIINVVPLHEPWIALVKRGHCDYDDKVKYAALRNASALVVYDREESDKLEEMKLSEYTIPGIIIFKSRGERIANLTDAGIRVEMHISVGEVCTKPYTGLNRTSVLFVSISFIVLLAISLAWLIFYYVQRFRYLHAKDRLAQRLCNAAKKALAKIPTRSVKLTDQEVVGDPECCAVCIDFYKAGDMLRTLPCRHEFHKLCVDPWLLEHRTCPMCKMDILKHYGYIFTGSQESILHLDLEDGTLNSSSSDSRDTDSSTRDETQQIHTHHQHHRIHHHPTDSLSISSPTDETFSSIPDDQQEYQIYDEMTRKPSLVSLTVTASPNGCITTTATPTNTTSSPPKSHHCTLTSSECLIPSRSVISTGCGGGGGSEGNTTPTTMLKASIASPDDSSTVITSLVSQEIPQLQKPIIMSSPSCHSQSSVSSHQQPLISSSSHLVNTSTSLTNCTCSSHSACQHRGDFPTETKDLVEGIPPPSPTTSYSPASLADDMKEDGEKENMEEVSKDQQKESKD